MEERASFEIVSAVPPPPPRNSYPFGRMAPGDSFEVVGLDLAGKVRNAAYQYAKKHNRDNGKEKGDSGYMSFSLRKTLQENTYRLWRS